MAYDAKAVANYFLELADRHNRRISAMKLQKLVYYAHGLCLSAYGKPLIDEAIEAWPYGPVVPSLYHEFKVFGSGYITRKASTFELNEDQTFDFRTPRIDDNPDIVENERIKELLDFVWKAYGSLSAVQLSNLTHENGTPWSETFNRNPDKRGVDIPDDLMRDWFASRTVTA